MGTKNIDVKIDCSDLIVKIRTYSNAIIKNIATDIRDDLTNTAADALIKFYDDYPNPIYYKRHWEIHNFINIHGDKLAVNSFKKYYVHYRSGIYNVGVLLSPYADSKQYKKPMINVYEGGVENVFNSVMAGYHGLQKNAHRIIKPMNPSPLEIIQNRRQYLSDHISDYIETYKKKYTYLIR